MEVITPKIRGFICTTAHPEGCYHHVLQQKEYIESQPSFLGPKKALIIGSSTGYGLASRIALAFGAQTQTLGVMFERAAKGKRCASAGWYNTVAFEKTAQQQGLYAKTINGDAFSDEIKQQTVEMIRKDLGKIDCVIYSVASPRRTDPKTGESFSSVLKPVGESYANKTVDAFSGEVSEVVIDPANKDEIEATVKVMGGEDWELWINYLLEHDVLNEQVKTMAYSYIGPELTHPIYKDGSIGCAKDDLLAVSDDLNEKLISLNGSAFVAVNKAVVTQSSSAIPVVPLYIAILFKVMQEKGVHEDCIEQMYRLFRGLYDSKVGLSIDEYGRVRIDNWEMRDDVQQAVQEAWEKIDSNNIEDLADLKLYRDNFQHLFGFSFDQVDYTKATNVAVELPSLQEDEVV